MLVDDKTLRNRVEQALHRPQQSTWKPAPITLNVECKIGFIISNK